MKEKHRNGCNILIMTFTNLKKICVFQKVLKTTTSTPPTQIDLKVSLEEDKIIPFLKGS